MLVFYHDYHMAAESKNVRRAMNKMGDELFPIYMELHFADTLAQSDYMRREKLENIGGIRVCYEEILAKEQSVSLKSLAVTGSDLIVMG